MKAWILSLNTGGWSEYEGDAIVHTAGLTGSDEDDNRNILIDDAGVLKVYPGTVVTLEEGRFATKRFAIPEEGGGLRQFRVRRVKMRYEGVPLVTLRVWHERFAADHEDYAIPGMESGLWRGIPSSFKGFFCQIIAVDLEQIFDLEIEVVVGGVR